MCCCIELPFSVSGGLRVLTTSALCRFVLENSGVAEPQNIRDQFNDGIAAGALSPAYNKASFDLSSMARLHVPSRTMSPFLCTSLTFEGMQ